jgi:FlaA1/EpsC-like NDP-sugar epimerase
MIKIKSARILRYLILLGVYSAVAEFGFYLSYYIRFDGLIPGQFLSQFSGLSVWVCIVQVLVLIAFGQAKVMVSYFSLVDLRSIVLSNLVSCLLIFALAIWCGIRIPRGVMVLDVMLLTLGIVVARGAMRYLAEVRGRNLVGRGANQPEFRAVAIVGAGDAGALLVRELLSKPALKFRPIAFFDDDPIKWGQRLHGIPIVGAPEMINNPPWKLQLRKIIVADPSIGPNRVGQIARIAADLGIPSDTLPPFDKIVDGTVRVSKLRPVRIDDLLCREAIPLDQGAIHDSIRNKTVVVTGAGGSIGSELCRQILRSKPQKLLLVERSEVQLFQIEQELLDLDTAGRVIPIIGDIVDPVRMQEIFKQYSPNVIFHAAAHKHVPLMEGQPSEAVRNNSLGSANLARCAYQFGVERFVLISTDKAINPTNVMGASKRLAEIYLQSFQAAHPHGTRFMAVRFGNVLGSSGSVVQTFQRQIAAGGPITVTHPEVTRYFMTIPEAVGLVLQAGAFGRGGEIFVLDMGQPVKIVDLARQMIELSGYRFDADIKIQFVGLRPGEKMFEEISHHRERLTETEHPKIFRYVSNAVPIDVIDQFFGKIQPLLVSMKPNDIKEVIKEMVPEYEPYIE